MAQDKTGKQQTETGGAGAEGPGTARSSETNTRKRPGQSGEPSKVDTTGGDAPRQPS